MENGNMKAQKTNDDLTKDNSWAFENKTVTSRILAKAIYNRIATKNYFPISKTYITYIRGYDGGNRTYKRPHQFQK